MAGGTPILALDMFEHSYQIDHGAEAVGYVDVFMSAINWPAMQWGLWRATEMIRGPSSSSAATRNENECGQGLSMKPEV
jgi:hypothetical protein